MTKAELVSEVARKVQDSSYAPAVILGFINDAQKDVAGQVLMPALRTSASLTTRAGVSQIPMPDDYHRELFHLYDVTTSRRLRVFRSLNLLAGAYPDGYGKAGELQGATVEAALPQAAKGTMTLAGLPLADETFVLDTRTFTFKASRSVAFEVTLGATAAETADNIATAVGLDLATVTAAAAGATVVVSSVAKTATANTIVFTEAATNLTMDGSGTLGGTQQGVKTAWLKYLRSPTSPHTLTAHYFALPTPLSDSEDVPHFLPDAFHRKLLVNGAVKEIFTEIYSEDSPDKINLWEARYAQGLRELELFLGPYAREPEPISNGMNWDELE